jgi:formylglycine-generating enzyme required for sulfatase activity
MNGTQDLGGLPTGQWNRLQDLASRFEAAWQTTKDTVDLITFLPPPEDPLRRVALHELIKSDMEARWRRGQVIGIESYLEKFPELGTAVEVPASLIYEEYRARQLYGDKPPLAAYERRFGRQFAELKRLIGQQPMPEVSGTLIPRTGDTPSETPVPMSVPAPATGSQQTLKIGGEYKMIRTIGCGGFAEVWQAETPAGFPVAIKRVLRPLDHAEAQVELRALGEMKQLRHPYLLQTRDYGLLDNRLYIVMDLAECTLADRLHQCQAAGEKGLPLDELLQYMREAAEAIDYMHSKKVQHRDIKPKNILLDHGHAKVADFGLARMMQSHQMSNTGSGTAPYMAPEVWRRQLSPHTDQYSLGVSYAELRLGRLPFAGTDMFSLMMDHIEGRPDLGDLPEAEQIVLRKVMSKNPDERYPSCSAFVDALEAAVKPPPPASISDTLVQPGGDTAIAGRQGVQRRRGPSWVFVIAGCAIILALLAWSRFGQRKGAFEVGTAEDVTIKAGASKTVSVPISHKQFDGRIILSSFAGAKGVTLTGSREPGSDSAELTIRADPQADLGKNTLHVRAEADGPQPREFEIAVTVEPSYWKPYWRAAADAEIRTDIHNRRHYSRIEVDCGGEWVPFVLVPQELPLSNEESRTFYIMEDKVWNGLYRRFAEAKGISEAGDSWQKGGRRVDRGKTVDMTNEDDRLPAFRMKVVEAQACAIWMGGNLPTVKEWDKASGYYRKKAGGPGGPYRIPDGRADGPNGPEWKPGEIAINRANEGPMRVGEARQYDKSNYGCHDMAGNGLEWTRNMAGAEGGFVPISNPEPYDSVLLRGTRYRGPVPWRYRDVLDKDNRKLGPYTGVDPEIGFRVVIELD